MRSDNVEMASGNYARAVVRRKWLIIVACTVTTLAAAGLTALQTPIYSASSQVLVQPRGQDGLFDSQVVGLDQRAIDTEVQVIEGEAVQRRVQADLGLVEQPPDAAASAVGDTNVISIAVRDANAGDAASYADAYANAYIEVRREQAVDELLAASAEVQTAIDQIAAQLESLDEDDPSRAALATQLANFNTTLDELRVDAALRTGGAEVIKSAEVPTTPVEPTPIRTVVLAVVAGLLIGLGAAFVVDRLDKRIRSEDDLESVADRPVLAAVPVGPHRDNRPIAISLPGDVAVEMYRGLRTNVQFLGINRASNVIQVTSSVAGEGTTTTSINLAIVLAQAGHRVALVDADLRRPNVHEVFGIPQAPGFTDILLGMEPRDVISHIELGDRRRLSVYPSGAVPSNPSELLSGRRTKRLFHEMGRYYDFVIVDSAPILAVSDAVALASAVDGVIVVAQAGRAIDDDVVDAIERLERVSAPVLGMVLNKAAKSNTASHANAGYRAPPPPSDRTFEIERPTPEELAEVEAALVGAEATPLDPPILDPPILGQSRPGIRPADSEPRPDEPSWLSEKPATGG